MRLIAILTAAVCIPQYAAAQSYYCSRPSEPSIPSPYAADYDRMERAQREVANYMDEMQDYVQCVQNELDDAVNEANDIGDEWDRAVKRFNDSQ